MSVHYLKSKLQFVQFSLIAGSRQRSSDRQSSLCLIVVKITLVFCALNGVVPFFMFRRKRRGRERYGEFEHKM